MEEQKKPSPFGHVVGVVILGLGAAVFGMLKNGSMHVGEVMSHLLAKEEPTLARQVESKVAANESESLIARVKNPRTPGAAVGEDSSKLSSATAKPRNIPGVPASSLTRTILPETRILRLEDRLPVVVYQRLHERWEKNRDDLKAVQENPADTVRAKAANDEAIAIEKQVVEYERQYG